MKSKTGLTANILARYGLCLSLKDQSIPNPDEYAEDGMEILPVTLYGEHENVYLALIIEKLYRDKLDPKIYFHKMTRAHFNRGTAILYSRIHDLSSFNELLLQERA